MYRTRRGGRPTYRFDTMFEAYYACGPLSCSIKALAYKYQSITPSPSAVNTTPHTPYHFHARVPILPLNQPRCHQEAIPDLRLLANASCLIGFPLATLLFISLLPPAPPLLPFAPALHGRSINLSSEVVAFRRFVCLYTKTSRPFAQDLGISVTMLDALIFTICVDVQQRY